MKRWLVTIVVSLVILGTGVGASFAVYQEQKGDLVEAASIDLRQASKAFVRSLDQVFLPAITLSQAVLDSGVRSRAVVDLAEHFFSVVVGPVRQFEQVNGAFLGFPDGRFLHLQDLAVGTAEPDPSTDRPAGVIRRRIIDNPGVERVGRWQRFDPDTAGWMPVTVDSRAYDPRQRPWYRMAVDGGGPTWTDAYVFASSGRLGVTYAQPLYDQSGALWAVFGVDLSLASLSRTLVLTADALAEVGDVIFATDLGEKILGHPDFVRHAAELDRDTDAFLARYRRADSFERTVVRAVKRPGEIAVVDAEGRSFLVTKVQLDPSTAMPLQVFLARDMQSVLASAVMAVRRNVALVFVSIVVFGTVATYAVKLRVEVKARERAEAGLTEARDAAEAATRAKSTFLATMSHEIRTPMNGVMSMAELLSLTRLDTEQRRMARIIADSGTALLTIINDILDFSKIEAGKLEIERVEFSLAEVVDGSAALLAARAEDKDLDLTVDIEPALVDARHGDPTRIRQVLLNLGSNAAKFTGQGRIGIRVAAVEGSGSLLRFEVSDTGIGLTPEQRGRLFQAFVQADSSTSRKYGGTGLGLSICQRLCELMGGRIGVESTAGVGSVFWFELPLDPAGDVPTQGSAEFAPASVVLVGLPDSLAGIADRCLRAAGVERASRAATLADAVAADLWIVGCRVADLAAAGLDRRDGASSIALAGRRGELAAMPPEVRARAATLLTFPLSRTALWRSLAVAVGLESADEVATDHRADLAFSPPDIDTARAAEALVLVAEDNETNQVVIRQLLGRLGFACEVAANGRIALGMLTAEGGGYGLLLTDFNMPEMDGFALAREIRRREADAGIRLPIVALTADALAGTEDACRAAGMDGYLTKPVDSRRLGATLADRLPQALALRRPASGDPAPGGGETPDWDPDVFDPASLTESFGGLDQEAMDLVAGASESWGPRIDTINAALAAADRPKARQAAHGLKGAALSVGALRLGRIAADVQDMLDAGDTEMAAMMADVLAPTLDEFKAALPAILRHAERQNARS